MSVRYKETKSRFRRITMEVHLDHQSEKLEMFREAGDTMLMFVRSMQIVDADMKWEQLKGRSSS